METALDRFGSLHRNDDGHEVWRIVDENGRVIADNVASDHDAAWLADRVERAAHAALGDRRRQRLSDLEREASYGDTPAIRAAASAAADVLRVELGLDYRIGAC